MRRKSRRNFRTVVLIAMAFAALLAIPSLLHEQRLLAAGQAVRTQTTKPSAQQKVLEWEKLTKQQFEELPDSQLIIFDGKQITLGEARAKAKIQQQRMARQQGARRKMVQAPSKARLAIDQLLRTQQQKFAAENAKVQTELKRLRQFGPATVYGQTSTRVGVVTQKQSALERLPQITKVFGIIEPGGFVLIGGTSFGATPGRVRLMVTNVSYELLLENLEWYPTGIGGRIPNLPAMVQGTGFRFVVETSAGAKSNEWLVNWIIEVKQLTREDVRVVSCSDDANKNSCNGSSPAGDGCSQDYYSGVLAPLESRIAGIRGSHANCPTAIGDDSGTDVYEIRLKNGWVLHEFVFESAVSSQGEGWITGPGVFPVGTSSWQPAIAWSVTPADTIGYWAFIYIRGPKGVPHK